MQALITQAAKLINCGKLVSFPTETVYALAADASNEEAVRHIYELKGRDDKKPLALLVGSISEVENFAETGRIFRMLAEKFWPGPITFILPRKENSPLAAGFNKGIKTIGVRMPDNEMALAILKQAGCPVTATSANISGRKEAVEAGEVLTYFGDKVALVADGGKCDIGIASTVLDLCSGDIRILREGKITKEDIDNTLNNHMDRN